MKLITLAQNITYLYNTLLNSSTGTYNMMTNQTGFCKMTGFNTISRSTSLGPPLFTSGRVQFGVGLSQYQFGSTNVLSINDKTEGSIVCGMCINITHISNFPLFNFELTEYQNINLTGSHIAMIFDQCNDPICTSGFLDIDVYSDTIFTKSNTYDIKWTAIDCPVYPDEKIEYLLCSDVTCNINNKEYLNTDKFGDLFSPYYFSIVVRNMRIPINNFYIFINNNYKELPYFSGNVFTFNGYFQESEFKFKTVDYFGTVHEATFDFNDIMNYKPLTDYRGGILI